MSPLEPSNPTIPDPEYSNIAEAQEKDLIVVRETEGILPNLFYEVSYPDTQTT